MRSKDTGKIVLNYICVAVVWGFVKGTLHLHMSTSASSAGIRCRIDRGTAAISRHCR